MGLGSSELLAAQFGSEQPKMEELREPRELGDGVVRSVAALVSHFVVQSRRFMT